MLRHRGHKSEQLLIENVTLVTCQSAAHKAAWRWTQSPANPSTAEEQVYLFIYVCRDGL